MGKKALLVGESWFVHEIHVKGFDTFTNTTYGSGEKWLVQALEANDISVTYLPNHLAKNDFPYDLEALQAYDCVILSDIGASTLLLPDKTFSQSQILPNRVNLIRDYVDAGGGVCMIGGYMTFAGIDGKGKWHDTALQEVLPVEIRTTDDRMEHSEGVVAKIEKDHEILEGVPQEWPPLLGYNQTYLKEGADLLVSIEGDPLIAISDYGKGRASVFTSDCAPHWAPEDFCNWAGYGKLFSQLIQWTMG